MWEYTVENILTRDPCTSKVFIGAQALNELPKNPKFPTAFIINTQPRHLPGEHWLAVHFNKNGFCTFFDSYGKSPADYNLKDYIESVSNGYKYNTIQLQGDSLYCGYYCVLFLLFKCRNKESSFFKYFYSNPLNNDKKIKNLINKNYFN